MPGLAQATVLESEPDAATLAPLHSVSFQLATFEGSWAGTLTGFGDTASGYIYLHGMLLGDGAYDGETAVLEMTYPGSGSDWSVDGLIYG